MFLFLDIIKKKLLLLDLIKFNFNVQNRGSAALFEHTIQINADQITETNEALIPTGRFENVTGSPYDLRSPKRVVDVITAVPRPGLDDNYCVKQEQDGLSFVGA